MMSVINMLVLSLSILFGLVSTIFLITAVTSDHWEHTDWHGEILRQADNVNLNDSIFSPHDAFYKIVILDPKTSNKTHMEFYLRSMYGGIWRICDYISDEFKGTETYKTGLEVTTYLRYGCFNYMRQYKERKADLDMKTGIWLVRMQNSASSCMIVALMSLLTAAITGTFGLITKQVSSCMVTGVMYIVGGVFVCFALVIMHTKVDYMKQDCNTFDPYDDPLPPTVCKAKTVGVGWSVAIAWASFAFLLIAFGFWLFLARCLRLEKAKSML